MNMLSRREKIEAMLRESPADTFLRYSLAMELRKEGQHAASLERLGELQKDDPPYVPAFLMSAQQLVSLNRVADARTVLRTGIEEARKQGDLHAAGEMGELLTNLGTLGE